MVLVLFSAVVMGLGLLFSASRGQCWELRAASFVWVYFLSSGRARKKGAIVLFLFLLTSAYALRMGVEQPLERFRTFDASFEVRARYAQKAYELFEDFKLMGVGVGNFRYVYPKFQAPEDTKALIDTLTTITLSSLLRRHHRLLHSLSRPPLLPDPNRSALGKSA